MDLHIREQLDALAERLHLHRGSGEEQAGRLRDELRSALDVEDPHGLSARLSQGAIDFENDHPDLASAIRRTADALSAAGI